MNTIVIITNNSAIIKLLQDQLLNKHNLIIFSNIFSALDSIYNSNPEMIIADLCNDDSILITILNDLKSDYIFGQISLIGILPDDFLINSWENLIIDDYIRVGTLEKEINLRIELNFLRTKRIVEVNPLTGLPGNISITNQIKKKIETNEIFAIAYADLDFFKPFNDKYGFSRGDEVIRMLGRLIYNKVREHQPHGSFVGHIGGDDFIYIMDIDLIEETSKNIIENYDKIIPAFYDPADTEKGYIESTNRQGNSEIFPIMSLSIGITHNRYKKFLHYGEVAEKLAEIKSYAKSIKGSYCIVDRRQF
ncbi:MAG: diguanylate cyclase [Thermodesulfovibrionales bacterium]|nr:diguanylate cyclase [Thermodesulfovibrionales bacterium]